MMCAVIRAAWTGYPLIWHRLSRARASATRAESRGIRGPRSSSEDLDVSDVSISLDGVVGCVCVVTKENTELGTT